MLKKALKQNNPKLLSEFILTDQEKRMIRQAVIYFIAATDDNTPEDRIIKQDFIKACKKIGIEF